MPSIFNPQRPPIPQRGIDSKGRAGPTMQSVQDAWRKNDTRRQGLENIFSLVGPEVGEAHAVLSPMSLISNPTLYKKIMELVKKGAKPDDIFRETNLVDLGKKDWHSFTPEASKMDLSRLYQQINEHGRGIGYIGKPRYNLDELIETAHLPEGVGKIPVNMRTDMDAGTRGTFNPAEYNNYKTHQAIDINAGGAPGKLGRVWKPEEVLASIRHEGGQHAPDYNLGLSFGYNPADIPDKRIMEIQRTMQQNGIPNYKDYDKYAHYRHNMGEVRASANEHLNANKPWEGLQSIFSADKPGLEFRPEMLWGGGTNHRYEP